MDAVKFFEAKKRICKNVQCTSCPLRYGHNGTDYPCYKFIEEYPKAAVEIVEEWASKHPEKTRQSEFLKMFPNAPKDDDLLAICPRHLGSISFEACKLEDDCDECKKKFWLAEVE